MEEKKQTVIDQKEFNFVIVVKIKGKKLQEIENAAMKVTGKNGKIKTVMFREFYCYSCQIDGDEETKEPYTMVYTQQEKMINRAEKRGMERSVEKLFNSVKGIEVFYCKYHDSAIAVKFEDYNPLKS